MVDCFEELIRKAAEHYQRPAVILVDEYDKPILDNIAAPEQAAAMREGLKNLYSVIKDSDVHLKFVLHKKTWILTLVGMTQHMSVLPAKSYRRKTACSRHPGKAAPGY